MTENAGGTEGLPELIVSATPQTGDKPETLSSSWKSCGKLCIGMGDSQDKPMEHPGYVESLVVSEDTSQASGRRFSFDPLEFSGSGFAALDSYRSEMLTGIDELRLRVACTRALGDLLTGDIIAQGRAVVLHELDVRNDNPYYPPVFLTFLLNPQWIRPTDDALQRMTTALAATPKTYREFVRCAQRQPMGGLFELNVYSVLDIAFPVALPQPKLPGTRKRSDVRVTVDGIDVYVEATVIGEAQYWTNMSTQMHARRQTVWVAPGPGPDHGARRVVSKIAGELDQAAENAPNMLCLSFFAWDPIPPAHLLAIEDAWNGAPAYGTLQDGTRLDLSNIGRLDTIFEFGRDRLLKMHVNPNPLPACRLPDATRERIHKVLAADKFMIR